MSSPELLGGEQSHQQIAPPILPPPLSPPTGDVETVTSLPQGIKRRRGRPKKIHTACGQVFVRNPAPPIAPSEPSEREITASYPTTAEAQYKADMEDNTGIRSSSLKSYTAYMRRWKVIYIDNLFPLCPVS